MDARQPCHRFSIIYPQVSNIQTRKLQMKVWETFWKIFTSWKTSNHLVNTGKLHTILWLHCKLLYFYTVKCSSSKSWTAGTPSECEKFFHEHSKVTFVKLLLHWFSRFGIFYLVRLGPGFWFWPSQVLHKVFIIYWLQKGFIFVAGDFGHFQHGFIHVPLCNIWAICLNGSNPFFSSTFFCYPQKWKCNLCWCQKILLTFHHCHPLKQQKDEENIGLTQWQPGASDCEDTKGQGQVWIYWIHTTQVVDVQTYEIKKVPRYPRNLMESQEVGIMTHAAAAFHLHNMNLNSAGCSGKRYVHEVVSRIFPLMILFKSSSIFNFNSSPSHCSITHHTE